MIFVNFKGIPRLSRLLFTGVLLVISAMLVNDASAFPPRKTYKGFYPDGTIREKGHFRGDVKKGIWVFYNKKGIIERKEKWKKGELRWQMFFEKGKVTKVIDRSGKVTTRPACGC